MKQIYFSLLLAGLPAGIFSQEVIGSQGESFSNGQVQVAFTIGEPVIETVSATGVVVTQGFHQTRLDVVAISEPSVDYRIRVFPNPAVEELQLTISTAHEGWRYALYDPSGKLLAGHHLPEELTVISLEAFARGTYRLCLFDAAGEVIGSYQVVKE